MLGDVERQGGLAHRRTPGNDDEIAALQARGHFIELDVAGRHPGDVGGIGLAVEVIDFLEHARQHRLDVEQALILARARLGDLEDLRLGFVQQLADFLAGQRERAFGDLCGDLAEPALHRAIAHQLCVAPDVDGAGGVLRQRREVGGTAGLVLVFAALDRVGDRDDVRRLVVLHHLDDVAPDAAVVVAIEVLAGEEVADLVERLVVDQQRAQQRLLRLDRMRRNPQCYKLRVSAFRSCDGL